MEFCWLPNIYSQYMNASYRHLKERHYFLKRFLLNYEHVCMSVCGYVHCSWCLLRTEGECHIS